MNRCLVQKFETISSGDLFGAFYQQLPMVRKDKNFGQVLQ